jgi:hypothetical protein
LEKVKTTGLIAFPKRATWLALTTEAEKNDDRKGRTGKEALTKGELSPCHCEHPRFYSQ